MKGIFYLFIILLYGCGENDSATNNNSVLVEEVITIAIRGKPQSELFFNESFNFIPILDYSGIRKVEFSIKNQPPWTVFNKYTGSLSGSPTCVWVGRYNDIEIDVSDGVITSRLSKFSIEVLNETLFTIEGSPDEKVEVDVNYEFIPILNNPEELVITFSIENKPEWMSFDTDTGKLTGQAQLTDIGIYQDIKISANCGDIAVYLSSFIVDVYSLSNFVTTNARIEPEYGSSPPSKGETRIDPITGAHITRLTDARELGGSNDALIVYSRYSPENITGDYLIIFGSNSSSSWVVNRNTGKVISDLKNENNKQIGENHEIRWHGTKEHPNRVYYVEGMQFWMIDDITNQEKTRKLIKDFSQEFPQSNKIYNDVEGDSSNNSDHWAWMAVHYGVNDRDIKTYLVDAFVHYQVSTNKTHSLLPADLTGSNLDIEKDRAFFSYRPNMVEISPLGTGVVIHMGRKWDDIAYSGKGKQYINTWFDGPHLWPIDFDFNHKAPIKISIDETHSGWSFNAEGSELFISQNNRTDKLDAIAVSGDKQGYSNRIEVASHADFGWAMGFHYGKMSKNKPNWLFMSTYAKGDRLWASNQLMMIEIKPEDSTPKIWRIAPAYNSYQGKYRDEAPAAINMLGDRIYFSSNWGGRLDHREVFYITLPKKWDEALDENE